MAQGAFASDTRAETASETETATAADTQGTTGITCPTCGATNEAGARFCGECGAQLTQSQCPSCTHTVSPTADFCEHCGCWLKADECCFCRASLPEGADFCSACGQPQAGISCSRCGTVNRFDFCSGCGQALTDNAQLMLTALEADPGTQSAVDQLSELLTLEAELAALPDTGQDTDVAQTAPPASPAAPTRLRLDRAALARMAAFLNGQAASAQAESEARQHAIQEAAANQAADAALHQAAARKAQQQNATLLRGNIALMRAKLLAELQTLLTSYENKTFSDHQEARRFFMAVQQKYSNLLKGWRCKRYGNIHQSPNECADPGFGGTWIIESMTDDEA